MRSDDENLGLVGQTREHVVAYTHFLCILDPAFCITYSITACDMQFSLTAEVLPLILTGGVAML